MFIPAWVEDGPILDGDRRTNWTTRGATRVPDTRWRLPASVSWETCHRVKMPRPLRELWSPPVGQAVGRFGIQFDVRRAISSIASGDCCRQTKHWPPGSKFWRFSAGQPPDSQTLTFQAATTLNGSDAGYRRPLQSGHEQPGHHLRCLQGAESRLYSAGVVSTTRPPACPTRLTPYRRREAIHESAS